jgi:5-methylcytosine-specific restriction endonuclease McrA
MEQSGMKTNCACTPLTGGTDTLREIRERLIRNANLKGRRVASHLLRGVSVDPLFDRQGGCCAICLQSLFGRFELDHKRPYFRGGSDELDNLQLLCVPCHRRKSGDERKNWRGARREREER